MTKIRDVIDSHLPLISWNHEAWNYFHSEGLQFIKILKVSQLHYYYEGLKSFFILRVSRKGLLI